MGLTLAAACAQGSQEAYGESSSTMDGQPLAGERDAAPPDPPNQPDAAVLPPTGSGAPAPRMPDAAAIDDAGAPGAGDADAAGAADAAAEDQCLDGEKNGVETGTDCGGPACPPCPAGQGCFMDSDCSSMVCQTGFLCAEPACDDGRRNGDETDVDCGGTSCDGCAPGQMCLGDGDCAMWPCGADNRCEPCPPLTADQCPADRCGAVDDGCGGTVQCPDLCSAPELCFDGACCAPRTAADCPADNCGAIDDGCGGTVQCPDQCSGDDECIDGTCQPPGCDPSRCPDDCGFLSAPCCDGDGNCGCRGLLGCR